MSTLMRSQMALSLVGSWADHQNASIAANLQNRVQEYQDTMAELSAAMATNAVTVNEVRTRDNVIQADQLLQKQAMKDQAAAEVNAAAAGVAGNSVEMVTRELKASAGRASYAMNRQAQQQRAELNSQKQSIAMAAISNKSVQIVPKPSIGSTLLGAGTNLLSIYDSHQPEGDRILGPNGGKVNSTTLL